MFSQEEASRLRQAFWTSFGQYMAPIRNADGERTNWINYKTGLKDIFFRMEAGRRHSWIAIEMTHKNLDMQQLYFEELQSLQPLLFKALGEPWEAQLHHENAYGKISSRYVKELTGVSVFRKTDWPALISFFKPRMIALDAFWSDARYHFESL